MIYMTGHMAAVGEHPDLGLILTPRSYGVAVVGAGPWAADNGCFSNPEGFDLPAYLTWLNAMAANNGLDTCLFATAPDVVGDAEETLRRSLPALPMIRELGYRAALVAQDGLETLSVPWDEFDCLFVGGSTEWKLSEHAYRLVREADERGKWTHMGRVNSYRRLKAAAVGGYDSADGTFLAFGPDKNLPRLLAWMRTLRAQNYMEIAG